MLDFFVYVMISDNLMTKKTFKIGLCNNYFDTLITLRDKFYIYNQEVIYAERKSLEMLIFTEI